MLDGMGRRYAKKTRSHPTRRWGRPALSQEHRRGKKEQRDRKSQCQMMSNIEWTRAASVFISI